MEKAVPVLPIDNHAEAVRFYIDGLGFSLLFEHRHEPGFPVHMGVGYGDLVLHLSEHGRGQSPGEVYLFVENIHTWCQRILQAGLVLAEPPTPRPWGNTEAVLVDPYGNTLRFSQIGTHSEAVNG